MPVPYSDRRHLLGKRAGGTRQSVLALGFAFVVLLYPVDVSSGDEGGTLRDLRESVRDQDRGRVEPGNGRDSGDWGFVFFMLVGAGVWIPIAVLDTNWEASYLTFPYEEGYPGYYVLSSRIRERGEGYGEFDSEPQGKPWAGRLAIEATYYNDSVEGYGIQSRFSLPFALETEFRGERLLEDLPGGARDALWLGQGGVGWSFAKSRNTRFFLGAGPTFLSDSEASDYGWYVQYGAESFPREPLRLEAIIEGGRIGHAGFWRGRVQAGVHWKYWEVFGGFRFQSIGNVDLYGPSAGVQFWF